MNTNRKHWNDQQKLLQNSLRGGKDPAALDLFLEQHAATHSAEITGNSAWSFADEALRGLDDTALRRIPPNGEHSIAWVLWHITRIEDITLNILIADTPPVLENGQWQEKFAISLRHTGNAMDPAAVAALSAEINLAALTAYRLAVGRRTREIVRQIPLADLPKKVSPARLENLRASGLVLAAASEILAYWGSRTLAGILLMPPTRHNFLHLNEILRIRQKIR